MQRGRPIRFAIPEGLDGLPGGGLNVAHEAVERHAASERRDGAALRWRRGGGSESLSFADLARLTRRFANVLEGLGVEPGERVVAMLPPCPELYATALGTLRYRAVFGYVPAGMGRDAMRARLVCSDARVLVTTPAEHERSLRWIRDQIATLDYLILVGEDGSPTNVSHTLDWDGLVRDTEPSHVIAETEPEEAAILCFDEGAGGEPACKCYGHGAVLLSHLGRSDGNGSSGAVVRLLEPLTRGETVDIDAD